MVINESALLRAMREDYKGQGYTVARRAEIEADPESESILLLSANDWMVEIGWKNVSAKIFGLVAEHMKGLPEVGQAFKVKKKETNTVIFDMVEKFPKHNPDERIIATHRTPAYVRKHGGLAGGTEQQLYACPKRNGRYAFGPRKNCAVDRRRSAYNG